MTSATAAAAAAALFDSWWHVTIQYSRRCDANTGAVSPDRMTFGQGSKVAATRQRDSAWSTSRCASQIHSSINLEVLVLCMASACSPFTSHIKDVALTWRLGVRLTGATEHHITYVHIPSNHATTSVLATQPLHAHWPPVIAVIFYRWQRIC